MAGERIPVHSRNKMSYNLVSYKVFLNAQFFQGGDHSQLEVLRILCQGQRLASYWDG